MSTMWARDEEDMTYASVKKPTPATRQTLMWNHLTENEKTDGEGERRALTKRGRCRSRREQRVSARRGLQRRCGSFQGRSRGQKQLDGLWRPLRTRLAEEEEEGDHSVHPRIA